MLDPESTLRIGRLRHEAREARATLYARLGVETGSWRPPGWHGPALRGAVLWIAKGLSAFGAVVRVALFSDARSSVAASTSRRR
ncbi:MAG: hypothetical protein IT304_07800 [Dehalococcoidia bacterium]|nr:hypothetical protein [Dehalococcoidia bacterium]